MPAMDPGLRTGSLMQALQDDILKAMADCRDPHNQNPPDRYLKDDFRYQLLLADSCRPKHIATRRQAIEGKWESQILSGEVQLRTSIIGWVAMVSGFSTVLYSRLKLIVEDQHIRRRILITIILNGLIFHTAMVTISTGSAAVRNTRPGRPQPAWGRANTPLERIQILVFSGQECLLSFFYVRAAYQYLRSRFAQRGKTRKAMCLLLGVQVIIVIIDIALIVVDFADLLMVKLFIHSFIYSVKLELELVVLNQLVELSRMGVPGLPSFSNSDGTTPGGDSTKHLGANALDWTPTRSPQSDSSVFGARDSMSKRPTMVQRTSSTLEQIPETRAIDTKTDLDLERLGVIPNAYAHRP
ncbi:hypothetical protein FKW77_002474 [Venturia effusa]|uniref:DUF7703 domain-containing protein n=1 Tax=Venturia effusa TaxID=50376 RepID=A0A517L6V5_9PEZI|nr:hypothetical protein FKW77_002474 [Venturia effusa]